MRVRAETVELNPIPEDCTLLPIISVAAALNCSERSARQLLAMHGVPVIAVGPRSHSARLSDVRKLIKARERSASRASLKRRAQMGCAAPQEPGEVFERDGPDEQAA
jgi:hypothetical protein